MLRLVSNRIVGAAHGKASFSLTRLLVLPQLNQQRVVYRSHKPRNLIYAEGPDGWREYDEIQYAILFKPLLQFGEKDLLTEESLWGLYQRWLEHYGIDRSDDDQIDERFRVFKASATDTHNFNLVKSEPEDPLGLDILADTITGDPTWGEYCEVGELEYDKDGECEEGLDNVTTSSDDQDIMSRPELKFGEKDLLTEESLWDFYQRWMKFHGINRSHDDDKIEERFRVFKSKARDVHNFNLRKWETDDPCGLGMLADTIEGDPFWANS